MALDIIESSETLQTLLVDSLILASLIATIDLSTHNDCLHFAVKELLIIPYMQKAHISLRKLLF